MNSSLKYRLKKGLEKTKYGKNVLRLIRTSSKITYPLRNKLRHLLGKVDMLYLDVTHACNLKCISCPTSAGVKKGNELNLEEQKLVILQAKKMGAKHVALCGSGEPLLYEDIYTLIDFIRSNNMTVTIFTNGTCLTRRSADFLITRSVEVFFKLWSFDPFIVDRMTGTEQAYKWVDFSYKYNGTVKSLKIPSGLKFLLHIAEEHNRKDLVGIEVLITRMNYSSIKDVVRFCKEAKLGLWLETILFHGRVIDYLRDVALKPKAYRFLYHELVEIMGKRYFDRDRRQICPTERNPVVFVNGDVGFCSSRKANIGNVRQKPLRTLFLQAQRLKRKEDYLIDKKKVKSSYFRACRARQYYHIRYGIPCNY